jgi:hypothetical protein
VSDAPKRTPPAYRTQLLLSLLAAVVITLVSIIIVTAKIGPGLDSEELHDLDDRREEIQEEREEQLEGEEDNSGPGR